MGSRKLKAGDIVFCERSVLGSDLYQHFGVYIGYKKIIHYVKGDDYFDGVIDITSIKEFCDGDTLYIAEEDTLLSIFQSSDEADAFYGPRKTVARAKSKLGTHDYDLFGNNCEHFALWCKTGHHTSTQLGIEGVLSRFAKFVFPGFGLFRDKVWRVEAEY